MLRKVNKRRRQYTLIVYNYDGQQIFTATGGVRDGGVYLDTMEVEPETKRDPDLVSKFLGSIAFVIWKMVFKGDTRLVAMSEAVRQLELMSED